MSTHPKIHHSKFDPAKLVKKPVEVKEGQNKDEKSYSVPIEYVYDVVDGTGKTYQVVSDLYVELPTVTWNGLIKRKIKTDTKGKSETGTYEKKSMMLIFDLSKDECKQFASEEPGNTGFAHIFTETVRERAFELRASLPPISGVRSVAGLEATISSFLYYPIDKNTCERVNGKNPSKWVNIIDYGKDDTLTKKETMCTFPFKNEKGEFVSVPLSKYENMTMNCIPLIHIKKFMLAGKGFYVDCDLISVVCKTLEKSNSLAGNQNDTATQLSQDEVMTASLRAQFQNFSVETKKDGEKTETKTETPTQPPATSAPAPNVPSTTIPGLPPTAPSSTVPGLPPSTLPGIPTALPGIPQSFTTSLPGIPQQSAVPTMAGFPTLSSIMNNGPVSKTIA